MQRLAEQLGANDGSIVARGDDAVRVIMIVFCVLVRQTLLTHHGLTLGILVISSGSACSDPEPNDCDAFAADVNYDVHFDEVSGDCLGPLQLILPDRFMAGGTSFQSLRMSTFYEAEKAGCMVNIQILKEDYDNAAEFNVTGEGLIDNGREVRGEVAIELSQIDKEGGTTLEPRRARTASRTPVCKTSARATLTRSADTAAAGSGSSP